jgi:anti-sigma factor RsiW
MNHPMAGACDHWRDDLAVYAVGALDPQPRAEVRRHLRSCPACRAEYEDLVAVVGWLALVSPPTAAAGPAARGDRWNAQAVAVATRFCTLGVAFRHTRYANRPKRPSRRAGRMRRGIR